MSDQVESPSREAIKAEAELQRLERELTGMLCPLIDKVSRTYLTEFCGYLIKKHEAQGPDDKPAYCVIDRRLQHLLDYIYLDFEEALEKEIRVQYEGEVVVLIGRDFGVLKCTRVSLVTR